jgi:hypothetical protein
MTFQHGDNYVYTSQRKVYECMQAGTSVAADSNYERTEESEMMKLTESNTSISYRQRCKNGLRSNRKHFILMESRNLWTAELNALKTRATNKWRSGLTIAWLFRQNVRKNCLYFSAYLIILVCLCVRSYASTCVSPRPNKYINYLRHVIVYMMYTV